MSEQKNNKKRNNKKSKKTRWMILVGEDKYGTDDPDSRITRHRNKATRFDEWIEAKWRSECIEYENRDQNLNVKVVRCK